MIGVIAYILLSEVVFSLDTWAGTISLIVGFTVCMLLFGVLLCVLMARQNRQTKKLEHTAVVPSVRALKTRQRYLL